MTPMPVRRARSLAGRAKRGFPLRLLRPLFPFALWRRGLRRLLEVDTDVRRALDLGAIDYDGGIHVKHRLMRYHDFFVDRVRPGERVLDVGCHKGELAFDLAERAGATVVGIDRSRWALDQARARFAHQRLSFVEADALSYEPDEPFDVVVLSNVLEHLAPRVAFLESLRTRVGAQRLLVRVPVLDREWTVPLRRELELPYFSDPEHKVEYDPDLLMSELGEAGWKLAELQLVWGEIWAEARPRDLSAP